MNAPTAGGTPTRMGYGPLTPVLLWLIAFCLWTVVTAERLFSALSPAILQLPLKIAAYVTAGTTALLALGLIVAFGLSCGLTLRWLEGTVDARAVGRSVCRGTWAFLAYTVVLAAAWFAHPPEPLTRDDLVALADASGDASVGLQTPWIPALQVVSGGAFLLVMFLSLSRIADRTNAAIAVAAGTSVVVLLATALRALAGVLPT